jgi:DNA-binding NtrC family response regulator
MKTLAISDVKLKSFDSLIGQSDCMMETFWKITIASENDITVLITGESGTGKELVARAIHKRSSRAKGPFIPVNMGVLSRELAPSELFGHEKGAFTGAIEPQDGLFEISSGGTLFLDEIESLDHKTQSILLRILENREYRRVGGKKTIRTNARIIASTNKNLRDDVDSGTFRRDLYFRLEVFTINLPPLKKRRDDIPLLLKHFTTLFNKEMGKTINKISQDALDRLMHYTWPGNVRELKNIIQRAMLLSKKNIITPDVLPDRIQTKPLQRQTLDLEVGLPLKEVEKRYIENTLRRTRGNKLKAAQLLGISRRALYNKIEAYNL